MRETTVDELPFGTAAAQDRQGIGTDAVPVQHAVVGVARALLTPEQLADVVISRVVVERAKGVLMHVYEIDSDNAFELLKWWSQATDVTLRLLARQLIEEVATFADGDEPDAVRSACDSLLFAAHTPPGGTHRRRFDVVSSRSPRWGTSS